MTLGGILLVIAPDDTPFYRPAFNNGKAPQQEILDTSSKTMIRIYGGVLLIFGSASAMFQLGTDSDGGMPSNNSFKPTPLRGAA